MRIRCTRKADEIGFKLLGFVGEYKNHRTITKLSCKKHGEWESTADVLLYCGGGCPSCWRQKVEQSRKIPKSDAIKRLDKFCRDLNLKFLGFQGDYDAVTRAKVVICCDVHGESVVSYRNLEKGCGCGACGKENIGSKNQKRRINESAILEDIQIFQDTGAFAEGTVFKRLLGRGGRKGTAAYWEVHCPECGGVGILPLQGTARTAATTNTHSPSALGVGGRWVRISSPTNSESRTPALHVGCASIKPTTRCAAYPIIKQCEVSVKSNVKQTVHAKPRHGFLDRFSPSFRCPLGMVTDSLFIRGHSICVGAIAGNQ